MASFFNGIAKFLVVFFNTALSILGIAFIVLGALVANVFKTYTTGTVERTELLWGLVAGVIILGLLLVVTSICGIVAVLGNKSGLAKVYLVLLAFIVIIEVVMAILFIVYKKTINEQIEIGIQGTIRRGYSDTVTDANLQAALSFLQKNVKCCGSNGPDDYVNVTGLSLDHAPDSCCVTFVQGCASVPKPVFFQTGCKAVIVDHFNRYSTVVIAVSATFAVLEVFAIAYSVYMIRRGEGEWLKAYMI